MEKLPESILLVFSGSEECFDVAVTIDDEPHELGRVQYDDDDEDWTIEYSDECGDDAGRLVGGIDGPFEAVGTLLDSVYEALEEEEEEEEGDDDEGDDEEEEEEEESGRRWTKISSTDDSTTWAMEIRQATPVGRGTATASLEKKPPSALHAWENSTVLGCILRVEGWGEPDSGEYTSSTQFLPGVRLADLQFEPPQEIDAEDTEATE